MRQFRTWAGVVVMCAFAQMPQLLQAQDLRALARVDLEASQLTDAGEGVALVLALSQPVPFRIQTFTAPNRVAVDFREVAFSEQISQLDQSQKVRAVRAGVIRGGWSRMVLELDSPMEVSTVWMQSDDTRGTGTMRLMLAPVSQASFEDTAQELTADPIAPALDTGLPVIALDPGHGGVDPGAQRDGHNEADLMLVFARELREVLLRSGRFQVVMTRDGNEFVSLPARVSLARAAQAAAFLSLHADAIATGQATGLTVYTLSQEASNAASAALAERQNRADIVGGLDLSGNDDQVAGALIDLARQKTTPRSGALADALVTELRQTLGKLHKRPRLEAGFSVLKAPDMPSVLIELGFLSSQKDLAALLDPDWRERAALGILGALDEWVEQDLIRQAQE